MSTELATLLVSSLPLWSWPKTADLGGFRPADPPGRSKLFRTILSQPFAPLQSSIASAPPLAECPPPATTSLAVSSPSTFSQRLAATHPGGNHPPSTCPLSVSHALRALLHQTPAGLVSCRSRPWGCTLQGRNPPAEPHLLSKAVALLRLTDRPATVPGTAASPSSWERLETTVAPDDSATSDRPHYRALLPASVCTPKSVV
jgi:hypothetical protein